MGLKYFNMVRNSSVLHKYSFFYLLSNVNIKKMLSAISVAQHLNIKTKFNLICILSNSLAKKLYLSPEDQLDRIARRPHINRAQVHKHQGPILRMVAFVKNEHPLD